MRQMILCALVWMPIASVSFAAKTALKVGSGNGFKLDQSTFIEHGAHESHGGSSSSGGHGK
jgi:hypothetical protein